MKFIDGAWATRHISVVFQRFRGLNDRRVKTVKVIDSWNGAKNSTVRPWAVNFAFTVFDSEGATGFVKASNRNEGKRHLGCIINLFQFNRRSILTVCYRKGNDKISTSDCGEGMSISSSNWFGRNCLEIDEFKSVRQKNGCWRRNRQLDQLTRIHHMLRGCDQR